MSKTFVTHRIVTQKLQNWILLKKPVKMILRLYRMTLYLLWNIFFMILRVLACPAHLQTCLYTIANCHIIIPSLPHRRTRLPCHDGSPNTRSTTAQAPPDSRKRQGVKTCGKAETTRLKAEMTRLKECQDDEVWRKVTEGDGTMWRRFDEEEKCWRVWGRRKTGVIRQWRTQPQLMCCALACGTRCPLISGARKTMRMMENKARMYRF